MKDEVARLRKEVASLGNRRSHSLRKQSLAIQRRLQHSSRHRSRQRVGKRTTAKSNGKRSSARTSWCFFDIVSRRNTVSRVMRRRAPVQESGPDSGSMPLASAAAGTSALTVALQACCMTTATGIDLVACSPLQAPSHPSVPEAVRLSGNATPCCSWSCSTINVNIFLVWPSKRWLAVFTGSSSPSSRLVVVIEQGSCIDLVLSRIPLARGRS